MDSGNKRRGWDGKVSRFGKSSVLTAFFVMIHKKNKAFVLQNVL